MGPGYQYAYPQISLLLGSLLGLLLLELLHHLAGVRVPRDVPVQIVPRLHRLVQLRFFPLPRPDPPLLLVIQPCAIQNGLGVLVLGVGKGGLPPPSHVRHLVRRDHVVIHVRRARLLGRPGGLQERGQVPLLVNGSLGVDSPGGRVGVRRGGSRGAPRQRVRDAVVLVAAGHLLVWVGREGGGGGVSQNSKKQTAPPCPSLNARARRRRLKQYILALKESHSKRTRNSLEYSNEPREPSLAVHFNPSTP